MIRKDVFRETEWYEQTLYGIRTMTGRGRPVIVGIDGRCGSGKSALASVLQEDLRSGVTFRSDKAGTEDLPAAAPPERDDENEARVNVFHTDDFYLPMSRRAPGWEHRVGGNMDFPRMREMLALVRRGEGGCCTVYECGTWKARELRFGPAEITILEGSYSMADSLAEYYDLKLFLTCAPEVQARRLKMREGERISAFQERWIPMEERYFTACRPWERCDRIIDTGELPF